MDQHTALPSIPRIVPPRSHTRTPSRSPTRRHFADDILSDLSPGSTLEAFTNPSGKLRASVEAATSTERAFGLRATLASKKIEEWVKELSQWPWPAQGGSVGFEMPAAKRRKLSGSGSEYEAEDLADPEYLGSILASEVARYEDRIDEIEGDMEELHVEEIKRQVLDTHFSPRSRPSSSASNAPPISSLLASYVKMDDFTAIVTATVLQSLPNLSRLGRLIDAWNVRLAILRKVPPLLQALGDVEAALRGSWNALEDPDPRHMSNEQPQEPFSREMFNCRRDALQDKVTTLGQDLDYMLDTLEGRPDTLPGKWLDRMEAIEQNYGEWTVIGEKKVRDGEWARQAKARKEEEDARVLREAKEADTARRKAEELELAKKLAEEAEAVADATRQAEEVEAARKEADSTQLKALQEAKDAEDAANVRRLEEEAELAALNVELGRLQALREAQDAERARLAEEAETARRKREMEEISVENVRQEAAAAFEDARKEAVIAELARQKLEKEARVAEMVLSESQRAKTISDIANVACLMAEEDSLDDDFALDGAQSNTAEDYNASEVAGADSENILEASENSLPELLLEPTDQKSLKVLDGTNSGTRKEQDMLIPDYGGQQSKDEVEPAKVSTQVEIEIATRNSKRQIAETPDDDYCEGCEEESRRNADLLNNRRLQTQSEPISASASSNSSLSIDAAISLTAILRGVPSPTATNDLQDTFRPHSSRYGGPFDGACSDFAEPAINDSEESSFAEDELHSSLGIDKSGSETLLPPLITTLEGGIEQQSPSSTSTTSRTFKSPMTDSDSIGSPIRHALLDAGLASLPVSDATRLDSSVLSSLDKAVDHPEAIKSEDDIWMATVDATHDAREIPNPLNGQEHEAVEPSIEATARANGTEDTQSDVEALDLTEPLISNRRPLLSPDVPTYYLSNDIRTLSENEPVKKALFSEEFGEHITLEAPVPESVSPNTSRVVSPAETPTRPVPVLQESPAFFERSFSSSTMSPVVEEDSPGSKLETGDGNFESIPSSPAAEEFELEELELFSRKLSVTTPDADIRRFSIPRRESLSSDTSTVVNSQIVEPVSFPTASPFVEDTSVLPSIEEQSPLVGRIGLRENYSDLTSSESLSSVSPFIRPPQSDWRDTTPDISIPPSTAIRFNLNEDPEPQPPSRPQSPKKNVEDQMQQQISSLLESIPARFRLKSELETNPFANESLRSLKTRRSMASMRSSSSMSNYSTSSRAATPSFTLAPAFSKTTQRSRPPSANPEIKVYNLSRSTGEAPIKLFVRLVGEQGERVMVRVGGGWADLGEYLKEYASHHGRRTTTETGDKVEIQGLPSRVVSTSSTASSSATLRGNSMSIPGPRSASVMEQDRPRSSLLIRKTRKSQGGESETTYSRLSELRNPSTPLPSTKRRQFETPPSAKSNTSSPSGTGASVASGSSSRLSWAGEEDSNLGLAGPKSRKVTISERDQEWIENMKEKVRQASAEKEKRQRDKERTTSFGEMDKVGGTKRLFRKGQGGGTASRRESQGGSTASRRESQGGGTASRRGSEA